MSARPYKCSVCQGTYIKAEHLIRHERIHTGAKPFPCNICGRSFARGDSLIRHAKVHTNKSSRRRASAASAPKHVNNDEVNETAPATNMQDAQPIQPQSHTQLDYRQQLHLAADGYDYALAQPVTLPTNMPPNAPFYDHPEPNIDPALGQQATHYTGAVDPQIDPMLMTGGAPSYEAQQQHQQIEQQQLYQPAYPSNYPG